jgi:hypothetical protein
MSDHILHDLDWLAKWLDSMDAVEDFFTATLSADDVERAIAVVERLRAAEPAPDAAPERTTDDVRAWARLGEALFRESGGRSSGPEELWRAVRRYCDDADRYHKLRARLVVLNEPMYSGAVRPCLATQFGRSAVGDAPIPRSVSGARNPAAFDALIDAAPPIPEDP